MHDTGLIPESPSKDELAVLRSLVEGTARNTGQEFFQSLVRHLAAAVETRYAFIAEFVAVKRVRSLAFWCRDRVVDNVEWDLPGTPCEEAPRVTDGVADGTANTLAIITAAEAVPWTKPADLAYSPDKKLPPLGPGMINDGLLSFATADSSVWVTRNTQDEKLMRALITRSGFEDIDMKNLRK